MTRQVVRSEHEQHAPSDASREAIAIRLLAPYAFYDDAGQKREWIAGQLVTSESEIAELMQRGAQFVRADGETDGRVKVDASAVLLPSIAEQHRDARDKHQRNQAVVAMLDRRFERFVGELARHEMTINRGFQGSGPSLVDVQQAHEGKKRLLREAPLFFLRWQILSVSDAEKAFTEEAHRL